MPVARPVFADTSGGDVFTVASIAPANARPNAGANAGNGQPLPPEPASLGSLVTAYAPTAEPEPDAQRAVAMILERRANGGVVPPPELNTTGLRSSLGDEGPDAGALSALINGTMQAIAQTPDLPADFEMRRPNLIAPDLENVAALFVDPAFCPRRATPSFSTIRPPISVRRPSSAIWRRS